MRIAIVRSLFDPKGTLSFRRKESASVGELLREYLPPVEGRKIEVMVFVDSARVTDFEHEVGVDSDVALVAVPGAIEWGTILVNFIIALVVSVAFTWLFPAEIGQSDADQGDPVYRARGSTNQARLLQVIPENFGTQFFYPDLRSQPWQSYEDNDQYIYTILSVGWGEYDVEGIYLEDTLIFDPSGARTTDIEGVEAQIAQPGEELNLFPSGVTVSSEISSSVLLGDSANYKTDDRGQPRVSIEDLFTPWYVLAETGKQISRIGLDVSHPRGHIDYSKRGKSRAAGSAIRTEFQPVDIDGNPVSGIAATARDRSFSMATLTPQSHTLNYDVNTTAAAPGVRVRFAQTRFFAHLSRGAAAEMRIEQLRGFFPGSDMEPNTCRIALKVKTTEQIANTSTNRFRVKCSRKLRTYDFTSASWRPPGVTSRAAWAAAEMITSANGLGLPDDVIDYDDLKALVEYEESNNFEYHGRLVNKSTGWDVLRRILSTVLARPTPNYFKIGFITDDSAANIMPRYGFGEHNIRAGSVRETLRRLGEDGYDSAQVTFTDAVGDYRERIVDIVPAVSAGSSFVCCNPRQITMLDIHDRIQAFRFGAYTLGRELFYSRGVEFQTGHTGLLPRIGDVVLLSNVERKWGASGRVLDAELVNASLGLIDLTLDVSLDALLGHTLKFRFVWDDGTLSDEVNADIVTGNNERNKVALNASDVAAQIGLRGHILRPRGPDEGTSYLAFLASTTIERAREVVVEEVLPSDDSVTIRGVVRNAERLRTLMSQAVPGATDGGTLPLGSLSVEARPSLRWINVVTSETNPDMIAIGVSAVPGEVSYIFEGRAADGDQWERFNREQIREPSLIHFLGRDASDYQVRVKACRYSGGRQQCGDFIYWNGSVGTPVFRPDTPTGLAVRHVDHHTVVSWDTDEGVDHYLLRVGTYAEQQISVSDGGAGETQLVSIANRDLIAAGVGRNFGIELYAVNNLGLRSNTAATLAVMNAVPPATTIRAAFMTTDKNLVFVANTSVVNDVVGYRIEGKIGDAGTWTALGNGAGEYAFVDIDLPATFDINSSVTTTGSSLPGGNGDRTALKLRTAPVDSWFDGSATELAALNWSPEGVVLKHEVPTLYLQTEAATHMRGLDRFVPAAHNFRAIFRVSNLLEQDPSPAVPTQLVQFFEDYDPPPAGFDESRFSLTMSEMLLHTISAGDLRYARQAYLEFDAQCSCQILRGGQLGTDYVYMPTLGDDPHFVPASLFALASVEFALGSADSGFYTLPHHFPVFNGGIFPTDATANAPQSRLIQVGHPDNRWKFLTTGGSQFIDIRNLATSDREKVQVRNAQLKIRFIVTHSGRAGSIGLATSYSNLNLYNLYAALEPRMQRIHALQLIVSKR